MHIAHGNHDSDVIIVIHAGSKSTLHQLSEGL